VVSQESFLTTGTHAFRSDMALETTPVVIEDGVWVTSRCMVLGGSRIGRSALILPTTVVRGDVPAGTLFGTPCGQVVGQRFEDRPASGATGAAPSSSPTQSR
jgi:putative colanic acid biosynthesis acetyltransferase WcaF